MTITSTQMTAKVRSNINEPSTAQEPLRTDGEIREWLQDAQLDYIARLPADAFPELISVAACSGESWVIPATFIKLMQVEVYHTISGTYVTREPAYPLKIDEGYLARRYPGGLGAWYQFRTTAVAIGPNAISGTFTYLTGPTDLSAEGATFSLHESHEEPVINYATGMALDKINDADSDKYWTKYQSRIEAENRKYGVELRVEREG